MEITWRQNEMARKVGALWRGIRILLAEDEDGIAEILLAYLQKEGFILIHATDGREALERYYEQRPDFVILDIRMPFIDGWQVLNEIRKDSDVPVMMLTALDADVDKIHALR